MDQSLPVGGEEPHRGDQLPLSEIVATEDPADMHVDIDENDTMDAAATASAAVADGDGASPTTEGRQTSADPRASFAPCSPTGMRRTFPGIQLPLVLCFLFALLLTDQAAAQGWPRQGKRSGKQHAVQQSHGQTRKGQLHAADRILDEAGADIIKESVRVDFEVAEVPMPKSADMDEFTQLVKTTLQDYLKTTLQALLRNDFVDLRAVSLLVTALRTRRLVRGRWLQAPASTDQPVTLQVGGGVQFDIQSGGGVDLDTFRNSVNQEINSLTSDDNIRQVLQDANVTGANSVFLTSTADTEGNDGDGTDQQSNATREETAPDDNSDRGPSTLSIIFGFTLTGIATAGLFVYAYLFYRKRKKSLAKKRQRKESVTYTGGQRPATDSTRPPASAFKPNRISPRRSVAPTPHANIPDAADEEESSTSSYNGVDESDDVTQDVFAKELQMAASLDQRAWEDFQRKTDDEDGAAGSSVDQDDPTSPFAAKTPQPSPDSNGDYSGTRSFPYGDEVDNSPEAEAAARSFPTNAMPDDDEPSEEGIEWTTEDLAGVTQGDREGEASPLTTDIVMEVERLSTFVKRYEQRKERQVQREHEIRSRGFARIGFDGQIVDNSHVDEKKEVDMYTPGSGRSGSHNQQQQQQEPASSPTEQRMNIPVPHVRAMDNRNEVSLENLDLDDDETTLEDPNMRLGITPFSVQRPGTISYEGVASPMKPMMQSIMRSSERNAEPSGRDEDDGARETTPPAVQSRGSPASQATHRTAASAASERQQREAANRLMLAKLRGVSTSPPKGDRLTSLRERTSIMDTTRSEAGVSNVQYQPQFNPVASTNAAIAAAKAKFRGSVKDLRSKFENTTHRGAIFPPDVSWQYGSSAPSSVAGSAHL